MFLLDCIAIAVVVSVIVAGTVVIGGVVFLLIEGSV